MPVDWSRAKRRLAELERRFRDTVGRRLYRAEIADGCVLLRAALLKAGIDPDTHETLLAFDTASRPTPSPEKSERRNADRDFAAADPVLSRRENFTVKARQHAAQLPRIGPLPLGDTFFEWVAWAMLQLNLCAPPPAPS